VAEERDVNLICFVGGALRAPHEFDTQRNVAYDLASSKNVAGLVAMSGSLGQFIGPKQLKRFYERYHPLPIVNIAMALDGIPSVLVDNKTGMRDTVTHLIEAHGCSRIVFIRGPVTNPEAEERYHTYAEVLAEHNIPLDPDLVVYGNFLSPAGAEAIRLLLDERKANFDAVASANDEMALGAMAALQKRGMRVPDDLCVVGFDDLEEARFAAPPLTTARQPLYEQGRRATEMLLALLAGEDVPEQVILPTELVVRRSCGCLSQAMSRTATVPVTITTETFETIFSARRERILSEMVEAAGASAASLNPGWAARLLGAFSAVLKDQSSIAFLSALDEVLRQVGAEGGDVMQWHKVLFVLRHHAFPSLVDDEALPRVENLWQQTQGLIGEVAQWAQAYRRIQAERRAFEFTIRISEPLMTAFDIAGLTDVVAQQLPQMGIRSCYLSLYEQPAGGKRETPTEWSRLILAYDEKGRVELEPGGRRFPSLQLVPEGILPREKRHAIMLEPLHFRDETQLGFILFEPLHTEAGALREALSRQISTALKGALLLQERKQTEEALKEYSERLEEMVQERTKELQEAQEQLIRREKLAILGQLAATVSHEIRNPLATIRVSASAVDRKTRGKELGVEQALDRMQRNITRCDNIISELLDYTRIPELHPEVVCFDDWLVRVLDEQHLPEGISLFRELASGVEISLDPERFRRVIINLINNAWEAMLELPETSDKTRVLRVESSVVAGRLKVMVSDTGSGIPAAVMPHIFEPLYSTKGFGVGLGLSVVEAIVKLHGGEVEIASEAGQGTQVVVWLPILDKEIKDK
jgi:DNA-binding LacI/PurR family transcriptional regulator/signal transduction histidine kinase